MGWAYFKHPLASRSALGISRAARRLRLGTAFRYLCRLDSDGASSNANGRRFQKKGFVESCSPRMPIMDAVYGVRFLWVRSTEFAIFIIAAPKGGSGPMPPAVVRGFSGHWMAFYSAAAAVLYSATHAVDRDQGRRCGNGHAVGPLALFCEQCGQPVIER